MSTETIVVFTCKSKNAIFMVGGTLSWTLNRSEARKIPYVVCARNAHHPDTEGQSQEPHGSAFLIGRVADVIPVSKATDPKAKAGRRHITFSEYAELDMADVWKGWRNPVRYTTLEELGIDIKSLKFKPMPPPKILLHGQSSDPESREEESFKLTIAQAKQGLANTFGVSQDAIEITIRG